MHSSLATFKAAFKEDKRHSLPSHRNTGIFRARHSHQRSTSPTQVGETQQGAQTKWRCQAKAGGSAPPGGGGGSGQLAVLSSCAAVSSEGNIQGKAGPAEALAGEGRRSREQPSTLHRTGFREKMKTCLRLPSKISSQNAQNHPPHPPLHHHRRPRLVPRERSCLLGSSYSRQGAPGPAPALWVTKAAAPQRGANTRFE